MKKSFLFIFSLLTFHLLFAEIKLPKIFGDNMVLQRSKPIPVWGWATPSEKVTVQFNRQTVIATAGKDGKWMATLKQTDAGGPYQLVIKGNANSITISNVLVGEVWICSGQSNMEMPIEGWGKINNYEQEIAAANYPMIRHFKVPNTVSSLPKEDVTGGEWKVCNPATAGDFTAVGYFFARELYNKLKVPVGLLNTSWGGTHVETWTSREAFENSPEFKSMIAGMPLLNLDSLAKQKEADLTAKLKAWQGDFASADTALWKATNEDDNKWQQVPVPSLWNSEPLSGLDGFVWLRKTIDVPEAAAGKAATLHLSMIDDNDVTYINGTLIGSTKGYNAKRAYAIPAGVLKSGKNVIAVRVEDTGGGGGIYGDSSDVKLTVDDTNIPLSGNWRVRVEKVSGNNASVGPNDYPTLLFNAMVNPLIPYAMRGVIWYQGESNAGRAYQYQKAFPLMITDWRSRWHEGDFPFYFVQLASFNAGGGNSVKGSEWAELREAQTKTLTLAGTGMAVTTDIGNATDIHPKNKQDVGKRLALIALHNVYGESNVFSGPSYQSMKKEGNKMILSFTNVGNGLMTKGDEKNLQGFEVAGADKMFHQARAYLNGNTVVVYSDSVTTPAAVHYGWADFAGTDNLFNKEGLPAAPFRTDNWKGITEAVKFKIGG